MISIITLDEAGKWDSIVMSFCNYDVYYLSGYTKAFKLHGDGDPILIYYQDKNIRAINVVMKRDIAHDKRFNGKIETNQMFDLTTPYGYGGFLIEGDLKKDSLEILDEIYSKYCSDHNIVSEFVRFHPVINNSGTVKKLYNITNLGNTVTMKLDTDEQIWNDLSSKNRNVIRKAKKNNVEIFWGRSQQLIDSFIPLYNSTMDKDNAGKYYYFNEDFYRSVLNDTKYNSMFFYAVYDNKIIAMTIILFANNQLHYHLSASNRKYQKLSATNLLLYEVACWGSKNGFKTFHLGGGVGGAEDSLLKFKKAFNKTSTSYSSIGKKIFDEQKYNELLEIRKENPCFIENIDFFPSYKG